MITNGDWCCIGDMACPPLLHAEISTPSWKYECAVSLNKVLSSIGVTANDTNPYKSFIEHETYRICTKDYDVRIAVSGGNLIVKRDSLIKTMSVPDIINGSKSKRKMKYIYDHQQKLIHKGIIRNCRFTEDYGEFSSLFLAGCVCTGTNSGNQNWKSPSGNVLDRRFESIW